MKDHTKALEKLKNILLDNNVLNKNFKSTLGTNLEIIFDNDGFIIKWLAFQSPFESKNNELIMKTMIELQVKAGILFKLTKVRIQPKIILSEPWSYPLYNWAQSRLKLLNEINKILNENKKIFDQFYDGPMTNINYFEYNY